VVTIVQSTAIVGASGIEATTVQVQGDTASDSNTLVQHGGIGNSNVVVQGSGIQDFNQVIQFTGAIQDTHIVNPSQFGTTAGANFVIFPRNFSRNAYLSSILGTTGTIEKFFDRSPFFFTPSETDPNTLRDISEAEQFLIFSEANIASFDPFRNTPTTTFIITDRGTEGADSAEKTEVITNGSFEQGLSGWTVSGTSGSSFVTAVTSQPTGVGFDDSEPVVPVDGDSMAHIAVRESDIVVLKQEFNFGTRRVNSSQLGAFSFSLCADLAAGSRQFQANILYVLGNEVKFNLRYRISGLGTPAQPTIVTEGSIEAITLTGFQADVFESYVRNMRSDLGFSTFQFDQIQTWFIFDDNAGVADYLLDDLSLLVNLPQQQLLKTAETAHVNTAHPIGTGQLGLETIPLTISGADSINQVDLSGPFFAETDPVSGTIGVPETTDLSFHIQDISSALDEGTINVFVDGVQVVDVGSTVTGTEFPIATKTVLAPNDIEYTFQPSLGALVPGTTITVSGSFADLAAVSNFREDSYFFTIVGSGSLEATISGAPDATPPTIIFVEPLDLAVNVSPNTDIVFNLTDDASGVDSSTVKLFLNGAAVISNDVATGGTFSRVSNTSNGFDYTYNPNGQFTFGETVTGTILAEDFAGNAASIEYTFIVTSANTLTIENFFLNLNESTLLTTGTIASVCVVDEIYGVVSGTTTFLIDGEVPSGLITTASGVAVSGSNPIKLTFEVPLKPLVNFREDIVISVHAENGYPGSYPVIKEQEFTLRPGYDVTWPNKNEDEIGGPESTFPYITNIQVLTDVKNFAKNFGEASAFYRFLTEGQHKADLGATIISNVQTADLPAVMGNLNPFFEYGKTMVLEITVSDLEGNEFSLEHIFVIEPN
jgi:hypothetical protein